MPGNDPELRCADADRERAVATFREHYAEGRLSLDEFQERSTAAYAAKTFGDLVPLSRDLPALPEPEAPQQPDADVPSRQRQAARFVPLLVFAVVCAAWIGASIGTGHSGALWPAIIVMFIMFGRRAGGCGGRAHHGR